MKKLLFYPTVACFCLLCSSAFFVSCNDDDPNGGDDPDPVEGLEVNHWMEKIMRENYLWYDEIPQKNKLDFNTDPESFFYSMLSQKDGKTRNNSHHYYSYIEENKEYVPTRTSIDTDNTYGMEFVTFNMLDKNGVPLGYYRSWVVYVLPDSPAELAGIQRGDWLTHINGEKLNEDNFLGLLKGPEIKLTILLDESDESKSKEITMQASHAVEDNPLYFHTTLNAGGKKVGYLLYNHFTTGPNGFEDTAYDKEMGAIFAEFAKENIDEFVLDLRYNGGGYISSATLLASMLVAENHKNDVFGIEIDNKGKQYQVKFNSQGETSHLKLNRLFVLTSSSTASASEAVINGLIPYFGKDNIILIGGTTEGKNVGSLHYSETKYEWAIQPIVMRITNKEGLGNDYSAGLEPHYVVNEFAKENDALLPFGNPNEYMLSYALSIIKGTLPRSRAISSWKGTARTPVYQSVERYRTNGVLLHPENWAERDSEK